MSSVSHAPRFVPAGSLLRAELSRLLRDFGYTIAGTADVIEHVNVEGTATGSPADVEDVQAVNALLARHFARMEFEDDAWPGIYSEDVWGLTDPEPPAGPLPSEAYLRPDLEPSFEDRRAWAEIRDREERIDNALDRAEEEAAALVQLTAGLEPFPATHGARNRPVIG